MGLSRKTFFYSIILAAAMTAFIIGYFAFMLPSLYVDYVMRSNLDSITEIHRGYTLDRSYDHLTVKNPSSTYSLEIPRSGTDIFVSGKFFRLAINVRDEELQEYLHRLKGMLESMEDTDNSIAIENTDDFAEAPNAKAPGSPEPLHEEDFDALFGLLKEKLNFYGFGPGSQNPPTMDYPLAFEIQQKGGQDVFREEYFRTHTAPEGFMIYEAGVSDNDYSYTTYVAFGSTKDAFLFTVLPTMTPQMEEIRPIVAESMPMIIAVVFLLVLLSSRFFSGKIVNPIIHLAGQAEAAAKTITAAARDTARLPARAGQYSPDRYSPGGYLPDEPLPDGYLPISHIFDINRKDEIGTLGHALSELYEGLRGSYLALAEKNEILAEENQRQEVFLRATSHQLKTPIAAALLLVEGMRNRIGKYQDTALWLPEVKRQLLSMQKIVEDVLYLNYHTGQLQRESLAPEALLKELLALYKAQTEAKNLQVHLTGSGIVCADREILKKILDNLLSNAVQYTPQNGRVEIGIERDPGKTRLSVKNYGATIAKELLPGLFEPFVTSSAEGHGKGLGLYIASYYSRLSGIRLTVENGENCVCSLLEFPQ